MGGLAPDSELRLSGETIDLAGDRRAFDVTLRTTPARSRVVLNEVLANANGAEPAMEWVELVNAGSASTNLEGYRLEDSGGSVTLPASRDRARCVRAPREGGLCPGSRDATCRRSRDAPASAAVAR